MSRRAILHIALLAFMAFHIGIPPSTFGAAEYTALLQNAPNSSDPATYGLFLVSWPSNRTARIVSEKIKYAMLSPDGRQIGYVGSDGVLNIMNNDGTGRQAALLPTDEWSWGATHSGLSGRWNRPRWTTNGIFWFSKNRIHRFIPQTGEKSVLPMQLSDLGTDCEGGEFTEMGEYFCSIDGLRVWGGHGWDPPAVDTHGRWNPIGPDRDNPSIDSLWCGCRGYSRGAHPYIQFHSNDFSSFDVVWWSEWGHGNGMTRDGHVILVELGGHRTLSISRQESKQLNMLYHPYDYDPPYPEGFESRPVAECINNDSILGAMGYNRTTKQNEHYWFYNWRTSELIGEFAAHEGMPEFVSLWEGPLPNPHGQTPFVTLDATEILVALTGSSEMIERALIVTNVTPGTSLARISARIEPAGAESWLEVSVSGDGGNMQTITNRINPALMQEDRLEATVVVSGGGADNKASYRVIVYRPGVLPAPSGVMVVDTGDSLLDVVVRWTDNSADESGFIVQRRSGGGDWVPAGSVGANVTVFVDQRLSLGTGYNYRVAAFRGEAGAPSAISAYSASVSIDIIGIPWIRILQPLDGAVLAPGGADTIRWTTNRVDQVTIGLSLDGGDTWRNLNPQGGIMSGTQLWGRWPWQVPSQEVAQGLIRIGEYTTELTEHSAFAISASAVHRAIARHGIALAISRVDRSGVILTGVAREELRVTVLNVAGREVARLSVPKGACSARFNEAIAPGICIIKAEGSSVRRQSVKAMVME